ncbi:hypothetical protein [Dyadobacter crusticola]|uniref:hypothetical protein n=1 Tax=Dyadobacter crusticola TaxID=292407 RepID=UPI0004E1CC7E|nr:hypothetical protein [Dyadobacter crusticola]
MIYVSDISSVSIQHEQFNKSFLNLLQNTFPDEDITFFAEEDHLRIVRAGVQGINFNPISVYNRRGGFKEFIRAYKQFKKLNELIYLAKQNNASRLLILLIHPFAQFLFKIFGAKNFPIYIVAHGELESLKFNKHFVNKIWGTFQKHTLSRISKNISYIILGKSIYRNLVEVLPAFASQTVIILDHPYPFTVPAKVHKSSSPVVFSTLGVATKAKNSHYFFQLAKEAQVLNRRYKFNICGRVYPNMQAFLNEYVNYRADFGPLSREELDKLTQESHFTVFYYENSDYSLCSSGSFWDSINAEIPMLYVKNDYFDYYASIAGPIGIPFNSPQELNSYLLTEFKEEIIDSEAYRQYISNIQRFKNEYMSSENLTRQLKNVINPGKI